MFTHTAACIVILVAIGSAASVRAAITVAPLTPSPNQRARAEWRIELDRKFKNPFDPDEIAVDVTFAGPDHRELTVPAFWCVNSDEHAGAFIVRFAPPMAGEWTLTVVANGERSTAKQFQVAQNAEARGFVAAPEPGARYFKFESGETFFPVGLNLAWANSDRINSFRDWFERLSSAGGNFARIWICHPNIPYETKALGPGKYDQDACAYYDQILEMAESRGIYCMLTINNHRDLLDRDQYGTAQWPEQPYNAINGGPCTRPADFITNPAARKLYRQRLRYTIARWSAYQSVFCWELWNEQSFTRVEIPPAWTAEAARYIQSIDPFKHSITTSFGQLPQPEVWKMPEIALTQDHLYPGGGAHDSTGPVSSAITELRKYEKPAIVAELGLGDGVIDSEMDPQCLGTNLHNAMWSSMMSGAGGVTALWSWFDYVAPKGLWWQFKPVAEFVKPLDLANRSFVPIQLAPAIAAPSSAAETLSDIVIPAGGNWTPGHGQPIVVLPNGQVSMNLPRYLVSEVHKDILTPTILQLDLPLSSQLIIRVNTVSEAAMLRVLVDSNPIVDFPFSALPGADGQQSTKQNGSGGSYLAIFHKDCRPIDIPAGKHTIELKNVGGDWLTLESVTLTHARSSRYAELHVLAMRDESTGDLIGWIHDPQSNWFTDSQQQSLRTVTGATLAIPESSYRVEWFDTWKSGTIHTEDVTGAKLNLPPITRDIAFRATRA